MVTEFGHGMVRIFTLLHTWPDSYCVLGSARLGEFSETSVIGVIQVPDNPFEPSDLYAVAGRHHPQGLYGSFSPEAQRAAWLACTAWGARVVPKPESYEIEASWCLDMGKRTSFANEKTTDVYGSSSLLAGRLTLATPEEMETARGSSRDVAQALKDTPMMQRARGILPTPPEARYGPVGQETTG